jgi:hypothetical protein
MADFSSTQKTTVHFTSTTMRPRRMADDRWPTLLSARGHRPDERGAQRALRRHPVAPRWQVRAQHQLAFETARLDSAVCIGDLVEGDPLGDARPYSVSGQQAREPLQILVEPGGMSRSHRID